MRKLLALALIALFSLFVVASASAAICLSGNPEGISIPGTSSHYYELMTKLSPNVNTACYVSQTVGSVTVYGNLHTPEGVLKYAAEKASHGIFWKILLITYDRSNVQSEIQKIEGFRDSWFSKHDGSMFLLVDAVKI